MKTILSLSAILVFSTLLFALTSLDADAQTNLPIFRAPPVTEAYQSNLFRWKTIVESQSPQSVLVTGEGENTNPSDYLHSLKEYFAVYTPGLPDKGTILSAGPLWVQDQTGMTIHDEVNRTDYYVPFDANDDPSVRSGSFSIAGETFWVYIHYTYVTVGYHGELYYSYPTMNITWGAGSSPNNVGNIYDDMYNAVVVTEPAPKDTWVAIINAVGIQNVPDGIYVAVVTPDENYTLQSSVLGPIRFWHSEPKPFYIEGYIGFHQFPPPGTTGKKFFRAKR